MPGSHRITLGGSLTLRMGSGGRHPNTSADVSPRVAASCIAKFRRRLPFASRCVHRRAIAINAHRVRSSSNPTAGADGRDISPMNIISNAAYAVLRRTQFFSSSSSSFFIKAATLDA